MAGSGCSCPQAHFEESPQVGKRSALGHRRCQTDLSLLHILLNRAGGYNRGLVLIRNLQVVDVVFDATPNPAVPPSEEDTPPSPPSVPPAPAADPAPDDGADEIPEDFGLIAFQWVEAHVIELNEEINEAIAKRESSMVIPASELPAKGSWVEICRELERNDLTGATCREDGIIIEFEQ